MKPAQRVLASYWIETAFPLEDAAASMAGEQSTGTFVRVPGETDELREAHAAKVEEIVDLGEVAHLDLDLEQVVRVGLRAAHGLGDPADRGDVVVFDQDPVEKGEPVVLRAADLHGVLLESPVERRRLARAARWLRASAVSVT